MGRKATGRTTKLVRVPVRFENQVKKLIEYLIIQEQKENRNSKEISQDASATL